MGNLVPDANSPQGIVGPQGPEESLITRSSPQQTKPNIKTEDPTSSSSSDYMYKKSNTR